MFLSCLATSRVHPKLDGAALTLSQLLIRLKLDNRSRFSHVFLVLILLLLSSTSLSSFYPCVNFVFEILLVLLVVCFQNMFHAGQTTKRKGLGMYGVALDYKVQAKLYTILKMLV